MKTTQLDFKQKTVIFMDEGMYTTLGATKASGNSRTRRRSSNGLQRKQSRKDFLERRTLTASVTASARTSYEQA